MTVCTSLIWVTRRMKGWSSTERKMGVYYVTIRYFQNSSTESSSCQMSRSRTAGAMLQRRDDRTLRQNEAAQIDLWTGMNHPGRRQLLAKGALTGAPSRNKLSDEYKVCTVDQSFAEHRQGSVFVECSSYVKKGQRRYSILCLRTDIAGSESQTNAIRRKDHARGERHDRSTHESSREMFDHSSCQQTPSC